MLTCSCSCSCSTSVSGRGIGLPSDFINDSNVSVLESDGGGEISVLLSSEISLSLYDSLSTSLIITIKFLFSFIP
ncbi:hypothetical protein Hanom_Chr08g00752831 [Helianthus anomalus]